jgi:hypothetical protein
MSDLLKASMKNYWRIFWALCVAVLLNACGGGGGGSSGGGNDGPPAPLAKTTLLVYVVGSDLESDNNFATGNIQEMMQVGSTADVNIILQTGGAKKDGWLTVQRKKVLKDQLQFISDIGQPDMAEGNTLRDFITWGMAQFPAERYMLVLWDHGGGPNAGFGLDENSNRIMSLPTLQTAVRNAMGTSGKKFELIGFDACLMASVEVADALAPVANYLVASQEIEPGAGWDWQAFVGRLVANPQISGADLGKVVADSYLAKMQKSNSDSIITLSVTDLNRMPALTSALSTAATAWTQRLNTEGALAWTDMAFSRRRSLDFQTAQFFGSALDMVDLGDFIEQPPMGLAGGQRDAALAALKAAVVYQVYGSALASSPPSGLTLYFPSRSLLSESEQTAYQALNFAAPVKQWVARYVQMGLNGIVVAPVVNQARIEGDEIIADLGAGTYASGFAAAQDGDLVFALKPLDANSGANELRAKADTGWFSIDGVPVLLLPDDSQSSAGRGRFTIPVALPDGDDEDDQPEPGLLLVNFTTDSNGVERYVIDGFQLAQSGVSPVAQRSINLPSGTSLFVLGYQTTTRQWIPITNLVITVPGNTAPNTWTVTKGSLPISGDLTLGINDYLGSTVLGAPVP